MHSEDETHAFQNGEGSGPGGGSEPRFLIIGQIVSPFGIRGAVRVDIISDFPERFQQLTYVYLGEELAPENQLRPYTVRSVRLVSGKRQAILELSECETRSQAETLRGQMVWIPTELAVPLAEGQYYVHQIIGLKAFTDAGEYLGTVEEVLFTGSNDVYVVKRDNREVLIPVLEDVILRIDLTAREIIVHLPEGLL